MKVNLSKYDNRWYKPGGILKRGSWYMLNILFLKTSLLPFNGFKRFILRAYGARLGKGIVIKPGVSIKYPWFLTVGDHCWIGENVWIDNLSEINIGNNVCISQGALLLCGNHDFTKEYFDLIVQPIHLEEGVWIGARSIVCPGTVCKSHAVLTAGSVARGILEPYTIYQGNPVIAIKSRLIR
jgi:putative colanic acid biosynthesis acetyltransferase WcaF